MLVKLALIIVAYFTLLLNAEDDKKWVWKDNQSRSRPPDFDREASARYEVFEDDRPVYNSNGPIGFNNQRPGYGNRPNGNNRPITGGFLQNERPGGVYGGAIGGIYGSGIGQGGQYYPDNDRNPGVLTGPVPSWVREGPYKNYDKCKCTERFNCNSPGISYGHCDAGKKYCCYATKKIDQIGEPLPSRPVHSPENGVLVGPGGPIDGPIQPGGSIDGPIRPGGPIQGPIRPGGNYYPRPGSVGRPIGNYGPGRPARPGFGLGNNRPIHSPENGVLIGPGGPYDSGYGGYGRSTKNT